MILPRMTSFRAGPFQTRRAAYYLGWSTDSYFRAFGHFPRPSDPATAAPRCIDSSGFYDIAHSQRLS